jgi:hypothetical protein
VNRRTLSTRVVADSYQTAIRDFLEKHEECQINKSLTYMDPRRIVAMKDVWPFVSDALEAYGDLLSSKEIRRRAETMPRILYDSYNGGHRLLEAIGLAQVIKEPDGDYLTIRNAVVYKLFDLEWVATQRRHLRGDAAVEEPWGELGERAGRSALLRRMEALAVAQICKSDWGIKHELTIREESGREPETKGKHESDCVSPLRRRNGPNGSVRILSP